MGKLAVNLVIASIDLDQLPWRRVVLCWRITNLPRRRQTNMGSRSPRWYCQLYTSLSHVLCIDRFRR
jgi:hypothetical protein